jgi:hypothetical protein
MYCKRFFVEETETGCFKNIFYMKYCSNPFSSDNHFSLSPLIYHAIKLILMLILMETWLYFSHGHKFALERSLNLMGIACPKVLDLTKALVEAI